MRHEYDYLNRIRNFIRFIFLPLREPRLCDGFVSLLRVLQLLFSSPQQQLNMSAVPTPLIAQLGDVFGEIWRVSCILSSFFVPAFEAWGRVSELAAAFEGCNIIDVYLQYISVYSNMIALGTTRDPAVLKAVDERIKASRLTFDEVGCLVFDKV